MVAICVALLLGGQPFPTSVDAQDQGTRGAGVRPKRPTAQPKAAPSKARAAGAGSTQAVQPTARETVTAEAGMAAADSLAPILAAADFDLIGLAVTASPATQTVPKNTPTGVLATMQVPEGTDPSQVVAGLNPNFRVRGELTGPSLSAPLMIEAPVGQMLPIPALSRAGDHVLQNLRVVDTGAEGAPVVAAVTPDSCGIVVIERILISEVHVNELSLEEIRQAGIVLNDDSYRAFNFTLGLGTTSEARNISIPVAFPNVRVADPRPVVGTPTINAPGIDMPTIVPVMLTQNSGGESSETGGSEPPEFDGEPIRIPGVIVFPGRVGFLHQFFEAIVIVANGAPDGTPLVLRNLHAKAKLPDNGTPADASDDPLRIAETQTTGRVTELDLHGLGADGKYGTSDDTMSFAPGQSGQGTFLLEGLKEGLHTVNFDLSATLDGLPTGPVQVSGAVPGAVLVRDASFAVTFTHPSVVRAGQQYELGMTMFNSGATTIRGAFAQLNANSISGAELIGADNGRREFKEEIPSKDSATIKWKLRANVTGAVTASYVKVGEGVSAGLTLVTGVGDRNVPLSPESLILPDPVKHLPPDVVEAGRQLLGQAWSVANAPPGSLPSGVAPVAKQTVIARAVEMGIAGMRADFGEPVTVTLDTLMRDWQGELKPDGGFGDATRNTPAGYLWYDSLGAEFFKRLTSAQTTLSPLELHQEFANAESPRSQFISVLATQTPGSPAFGARLVSSGGQRVGFGANGGERFGDLQAGGSLRLDAVDPLNGEHTGTVGQMLVVSNPDPNQWTLELHGWQAGTVDLSLLVAATSRSYRHLTWSGVQVGQDSKHRIVFRPLNVTVAPVLEELRAGVWQSLGAANVNTLNQPAPKVVGVIQVTPEVLAGGDKYGRLVGVLFSKPMSKTEAETISRYKVVGGALKNSNPPEMVGGTVKVTGAKLDYGDRFAFVALDAPVGPYIQRELSMSGLYDSRRMPLTPSPSSVVIGARVSPQGRPPGAYLTGRVMNADGTPVANAPVVYWSRECEDGAALIPPPPTPIAVRYTDEQGRYSIDYVRDGDCAPLSITVNNPVTRSEKRLSSSVAYDGQHMVFDLVFLARGNVQGTVTSGGRPVAKAFVQVVPSLDAIGTKVTETDEQGRYLVEDIPVGNVSVISVGSGDLRLASGLAAGNIDGPGLTATVNVSLQQLSGSVRGRVVRPDGSPGVGALVVAYARIPGFPSNRGDGAIAVGYDYTGRDGEFKISNLPIGSVSLEVRDYVTGLFASQSVQLSPAQPEISGVFITLPGQGSVTGRVTDENGIPIANAHVTGGGRAVRTDAQGEYTLLELPAGNHTLSATDPNTGLSGSALALVRLGEITSNINISILRPAQLEGRVFIVKEGTTTPVPAPGVKVTTDGTNIAETDTQGNYKLQNVRPNSQLTLRFVDTGKGLAVNMPVIVLSGETLIRNATFRPGSIHGKIYQPDGTTPTVAQLTAYVSHPILTLGPYFGIIDTDAQPLSVQSAADGSYSLHGINPGKFRLTTSNAFFPTRVSEGGILAPGGDTEVNLTLVSTLTGKIQGHIFQPDGTTPVGAGVRVALSGGSLADVTVRTDENGYYEFAEVFSAGNYALTATDTLTGRTNRIYISVGKNKDAVFDMRLLGTGGLRVRVIDGAGNPAQSGHITVSGSNFPNHQRFAEITPDSGGVIEFANLFEGRYAISASQRGLGGRADAIVPVGSTVEVTIQLHASGTVKGKVFMPGGTTPIGLSDVELRLGGRSVGFTITSDTDEERGSFTFLNVPVGDFTLDIFDNRTGRVGRSAGRLTVQDEVATVNVELLSIGAVTGRVTANGNPVDHALVQIYADGSGIRGASLRATTDADGRYRFTGIPVGRVQVNVSDAPGGQTGSAFGTISGVVEPLADTVIDVTLEASQTLIGTVYKQGGTQTVAGAQVTVFVGGRTFRAATNEHGAYRIEFIPLGEVRVRVEAPTGYDRGEATPVTGTQPGATINSDVTLAGTAHIEGFALDSNGSPLAIGTITYTNDVWGSPVIIIAAVQANGHYEIKGAPVGSFSLKLTAPNRVGVGTASGQLTANQTMNLTMRLEDAGRIVGTVKSEDGGAPVVGADVILTLSRTTGQQRFYAHTNAQGAWSFDNIPLGGVFISINDVSGAKARIGGLALATNGQELNVGETRIDGTPITVSAIVPPDGATGITNNAPVINITFSEPAEPGSVHSGSLRLRQGSAGVGIGVSLSEDGRVATLRPTQRLNDTATYTIIITTDVEDRVGHHLERNVSANFVTSDETPPTVTSITPSANTKEVETSSAIVVTFSEPLEPSQDFMSVMKLTAGASAGEQVAGAVVLDATGKVATFTPSTPLGESRLYTVNISGQRDVAGNAQPVPFTSNFTTFNPPPTVSLTSPAQDAPVAENQHINLSADASDNTGVARVQFTANNVNVGNDNAAPYSVQYVVPTGITQLTVTATVTDDLGKTAVASRTVTVVPDLGGTVAGIILDQANQPVTNASVTVAAVNGAFNMVTGADGRYQFDNIGIGDFVVTAMNPGGSLRGRASGSIESFSDSLQRNIQLVASGIVTGVIFRADGTTPLAGARVVLHADNFNSHGGVFVSDANGRYTIDFVPLGSFVLDVTDPATGDRGQQANQVNANGETRTVNVIMNGVGRVVITVRDNFNNLVSGAEVSLSSQTQFGGGKQGTTGNDGKVTLENVLAGNFNISAFDQTTGLRGYTNGSVTAGAVAQVNVQLQPAGTIAGRVLGVDGTTPRGGLTVRLLDSHYGWPVRQTTSAEDGAFSFETQPLGTYILDVVEVIAGSERVRDRVSNVTLSANGQTVTRDLRLIGLGTVTGRVLDTTGAPVPLLYVSIRSLNSAVGGYHSAMTNASGVYTINHVPTGRFSVTANDSYRRQQGETFGEITQHGQSVNADIQLLNNTVLLPQYRYDANNAYFDIQPDGSIGYGLGAAYTGDNNTNRGAFYLDIIAGGSPYRFNGVTIGTQEENGREIAVRQQNLAGLEVTRKIYTPRDGYFARYVEILSNPTSSPMTVGVRVMSNIRHSYFTNDGNNLVNLVSTSSGDTTLDVADATTPDRWAVVDDGDDQDPFLSYSSLPALSFVFDGANAPERVGEVSFTNPRAAQISYQWNNVTIPAGGTVAYLHFGVQQLSRAGARASAERLAQLPPEVLSGLSDAEIAAIRNFAVPSGGLSTLAPLPSLNGTINGRLLAGDGATSIRFGQVEFKSKNPLFGRTFWYNTDANGAFSFASSWDDGASQPIPIDDFTLVGWHPHTRRFSPAVNGSFAPGQTTVTQNVVFGGTGIIRGFVRRHSGEVATGGGTITLRIDNYDADFTIQQDGSFELTGLPAGSYLLTARVRHPQGGVNTGTAATLVTAGQVTTQDVTLQPTGTVTGTVRDAGGNPASVRVRLYQPGCYWCFYREVNSDAAGQYTLSHVPNGTYTLEAYEPNTDIPTTTLVTIGTDQILTKDLNLIGTGTVQVQVNLAGGSPVAHSLVHISEEARGQYFRHIGYTDAAGRLTIRHIAVGNFILRAYNSNTSVYGDSPGRISVHGETVSTIVTLPGTGVVTGRVLYPDGTPAAGSYTELYGTNVPYRYTYTDTNGYYTFSQIKTGTPFIVRASNPNDGNLRREVPNNVINGDGETLTLNLTLPAHATVRVTVLNSDSTPFANAQVFIQDSIRQYMRHVGTTGANGVVDIPAVPEGEFSIRTQQAGTGQFIASSKGVVRLADNNQVVNITLRAAFSGNINGTLYAADGETVSASQWVFMEVIDAASGSTFASAYTNTGQYEFNNVRFGEQGFIVRASRYQGWTVLAESSGRFESEGETRTFNFTLPFSVVKGRVTFADGTPVAYPSVYLYQRVPDGYTQTLYGSSDADGNYAVAGAELGDFTLTAQDGDSGLTTFGAGTIVDTAVPVVVNMSLPPSGTVSGRVTIKDATGNIVPVPFANVMLAVEGHRYERYTSADAEGNYTFERVGLGLVTLTAEDSNNEGLFGMATGMLVNSGDNTTVNITVPESGTVTGVVYRADGTTRAANIRLVISAPGLTYERYTMTNADGSYTFEGIPVGSFVIQARDTATSSYFYGLANGTLTTPNATTTFTINMLATGSIRGRVLRADGTPVTNISVKIEGFASAGNSSGYRQSAKTDSNGVYALAGVPVGLVRAETSDPRDWRNGGYTNGNLTVSGLTDFNVTLGGGNVFGDLFNLDGDDGFRYDFWSGGELDSGGTTDDSDLYAYSGSGYFLLNGDDYPPYVNYALKTDDGRGFISGPVGINGLHYTRKVYSPQTGGFARYLEVLTNPTSTDITVRARIEGWINAREEARVVVAPSANGNHYVVIDSKRAEALSTAFVMGGPGAASPVTLARFVNNHNYHYFEWNVTIPAGQTRIIMHYTLQRGATDTAGAQAQAEALMNLTDLHALDRMSETEKSQVATFNVPNTASASPLKRDVTTDVQKKAQTVAPTPAKPTAAGAASTRVSPNTDGKPVAARAVAGGR
jgi:hypothetical protein